MTEFKDFGDPPFEWGDRAWPGTGSELTKQLVENKYNSTMQTATDMLSRLIGDDGNSGYLGALNGIIEDYQAPTLGDFATTVPDLSVSVENRPIPDISGLDTDFPTFDKVAPSMLAIPTVDITQISSDEIPDSISVAINWVEEQHDTGIFDQLVTRLIEDLQSGATGLDANVEAEIFARALARQQVEDDKLQAEIEDYYSTRGFALPPGAMAGRLQEQANARGRNTTDLNAKVMIEQAELAQKNSQFVITAIRELETVLRDFTSKKNDRNLDYSKAVAANAISIFSEEVRKFIAKVEANKAYVQVQVENLKAIVANNQGLIDVFKAEADAYNTIIEGKSKQNDAVIKVFDAEVTGYEAETKALSENQKTKLGQIQLQIQSADNELKVAIAEAENSIKAYTAESSLRERVSADMANIAMQSVASAYSSVNMSAGISHKTGRSESDSFTHTEGRSAQYSRGNARSEQHKYDHPVK